MIALEYIQDIFKDKTVSLVGNASSLYEKHQKDLIEKNNLVCRINRGYESTGNHSGDRTDILFYSKPDIHLDLSINQINPLAFVHLSPVDQDKQYNEKTYFFPENDWWEFRKSCKLDPNKWPSTGLVSIFFLLSKVKIKSIDIFGFDFKKSKTFYHTEQTRSKARHDWAFEETFLRDLTKKDKRINLFN